MRDSLVKHKRRFIGWVLFFLCAAALLAAPRARAQETDGAFENRRVVAVRVVAESGEVLEENPAQIPLQTGETYSSETVRESLRLLFKSGRYADVRAEAAEVPGGVRLDFIVRPSFFINVVHVVGMKEPPSEAMALSAMQLGLGQTFRESMLPEAMERLRGLLAEEGLYQPRMEHQLAPKPATQQMDILVQVTPGQRAKIGHVEVRNLTRFEDADLLRRSKLRPGQALTRQRIERGTERVRKFLVKKGYLGARALVRRGEFDAPANQVPLALEISAGPSVRVEVTGAKISSKDLRRLLPIYQEGAVDEDLLQEGRRVLRDYLERQGYFDSDATYSIALDEEKQQQVITYQIVRGPQRRLVGTGFDGNHYFQNELLSERLRVLPASVISRGRFSRRLLRDDEDSIRDLYVANGFQDAKVSSEILEDYQGKEGDLFVRFHVEEGPQTLVAALEIEGNQKLSNDYLFAQVNTTRCQPYSEFNMAGDRDNLLAIYFNEGFPGARFEASSEEAADSAAALKGCPQAAGNGGFHAMRLTYRVVEGPQITVRQVLVGGYEYTRRKVIDREIKIEPGEPLREGDVVETQRRLYNVGIFSRVAIAPQNPEGSDTEKTLVVQLEEAKRWTVGYGFGLETQRLGGTETDPVSGAFRVSPRGLVELTKANFTGRGDTLSFRARGSTIQGRALLSYTTPYLWNRENWDLLVTGFAEKTSDVRTFTARKYEASVQMIQRWTSTDTVGYRYAFRRVVVDPNSLRVDPLQVPLLSQPTEISSFGASWVRERRDNPADASRGYFNNVDLAMASKTIGASTNFVRLFAQNSTFYRISRNLNFARSTRFGMIRRFGGAQLNDIPLPERFFAGGGNSLRGFGLNQAGPRSTTGFPVGGEALIILNQELRFPLRLPFVRGDLGGALFYDAGNVFDKLTGITLRFKPEQSGGNFFSHTVGLSLRYATPIGPVRLDLGYLLNSIDIQVTNSTTMTTETRRLPRFQFFFNIGSIF